jgi:hypothetical protein
MDKTRLWFLGACALLGGAPALPAAPPGAGAGGPDALALAARIDHHVGAGLKAADVEPAPPADDAEFARRVYLDLAGRIPSVAEVRTFLDDRRPDKRRRLVDGLLDGPRYVTHFTHVWRALLLPESGANLQTRFLGPGFEAWLSKHLSRNTAYDQMVRELLTLPVAPQQFQQAFGGGRGEPSPAAFYLAKEYKPENLAAATSRLFLGVKLECAQCHNHPFADWKRDQFWSFAAFFGGIESRRQGDFTQPTREVADRRELTIPGTDRVVQAKFLDGAEPKWKFKVGARVTLADWLTAKDNPYFARATVNRLWAYFLGTGLIDPVDEMVGTEHVASHPELLDELAGQFAAHDFDLKFLIRAITLSGAYQTSSVRTHKTQDEPRHFARMPLRGLSPEQLFDSVAQATGYQEGGPQPQPVFIPNGGARNEFVNKFANQSDKPTEVQTSILQALSLMNGRLTGSATSLQQSETLAAVLDAPFMDTADRIETLYLAALSRKPRPRELERLTKYVDNGGSAPEDFAALAPPERDKRYNQALADVFWVLLNSGEFFLNH